MFGQELGFHAVLHNCTAWSGHIVDAARVYPLLFYFPLSRPKIYTQKNGGPFSADPFDKGSLCASLVVCSGCLCFLVGFARAPCRVGSFSLAPFGVSFFGSVLCAAWRVVSLRKACCRGLFIT